MASENTARIAAGRLLVIDVAAGYRTASDVDDMTAKIKGARAGLPASTRIVIVADWRTCNVFPPAVAEKVQTMFRSVGAIERSALLHAANHHTSVMQIVRLIREANFPDRRVFLDPTELEGWLSEVLEEREKKALHTFLTR